MSHGVILSDKNKALLEKGRGALTCCCNGGIFRLPIEHPLMHFPYPTFDSGSSSVVQFADQSTNLTWCAPNMSYGWGFTGKTDTGIDITRAAPSIYEPCTGQWLMYPYNLCSRLGDLSEIHSAYWNYPAMNTSYPFNCALTVAGGSEAYAGVTYHYDDSRLLDFEDNGRPHFFLKLPPLRQTMVMYDSDLNQTVNVICTYEFTDFPEFTDSLKPGYEYSWRLLTAEADYYLTGDATKYTKSYKVRSDCYGTIKWTFQTMSRSVDYYDNEGNVLYTRYCYPLAKSFSGGSQDLTVDITSGGAEIFHEFVHNIIIIPETTDLECLETPSYSLMGVCSFSDSKCSGCLLDTYTIEVLDDDAQSLNGLCMGTGLEGSYRLTLLLSDYRHYEIGSDGQLSMVVNEDVDKDELLDSLKNECAGDTSWSVVGTCRCCTSNTCDDCVSLESVGTACSHDIDVNQCKNGIKTVILNNGFATQADAYNYIENNRANLLSALKNICSFAFSTAVVVEGNDLTGKTYELSHPGTYKITYAAGALRNGSGENWNCGDHIPQYSVDGGLSWTNFPGAWGVGSACFSTSEDAANASIGTYAYFSLDTSVSGVIQTRNTLQGDRNDGSVKWTVELTLCQI